MREPAGRSITVKLGKSAVLVSGKIYLFLPPSGSTDRIPVLDYATYTWEMLETSVGPFPRHAHTATLVGDVVLLLGGVVYGENEDDASMNVFDLATNDWFQLKSFGKIPNLRKKHVVEYFERSDTLALFSYTDVLLRFEELFLFDVETSTWAKKKTHGALPAERALPTTCVGNDKMFLFAGNNGASTNYNDLYVLQLVGVKQIPTWSSLPVKGTPPPGVIGSALAIFDRKLFVIGGFAYNQTIAGFFCYDLETNEWFQDEVRDAGTGSLVQSTGTAPGRNYGVAAVATAKSLIVFGGVQGNGDEVYVLEP